MKPSTRPFKKSDYSQYNGIFDQVDKLHRDALPEYFRKPNTTFRTELYFNNLLADSKTLLLGAFDPANNLVGLAHAAIKEQPDTVLHVPGTYVLLDNLIVSENHRRCGIGKILFNEVLKWATESKINEIQLKVYAFNSDAIQFYRNLGFNDLYLGMRRRA